MKKKWLRLSFLLILPVGVISGRAAGAGADEFSLPEVVVTDSRMETLMKNAPGFISVIRGEEIRDHLETVSEAMGWATGANPLSYGSLGSRTGNSLRGSTNDQVLVLLDGVRLNDAQGGGFDLGSLASLPVERIEILRGGASALYGTNAVGGVINIVTRRPTIKPENHVDLSWGSDLSLRGFNTYTASLGRSQRVKDFSYKFDFTHQQSEGNFNLGPYSYLDSSGNNISRIRNNAYRSEAFSARLGWEREKKKFELANDFYQGKKEVPWSWPNVPSLGAEQENLRNLVCLSGSQADFIGLNSLLGEKLYFQIQQKSFFNNEDIPKDDPSESNNYSLGGEVKWDLNLGSRLLITIAPEIKRDWIETNQYSENHQRITASLFSQGRVNLFSERLFLVPAFRFDYHNDFGRAISPKAGVVLAPINDFRIKLNYGLSFRAPNFDDLYWESPGMRGNPGLKPEKALNLDGGFSCQIQKILQLELAGFYNWFTDLIQWAPGESDWDPWAPENVGKAQIWGIESDLIFKPFSFLSLKANHTYLQARDHSGRPDVNQKDLIYRPRNKISGIMDVSWKLYRAFGEARWLDRRYTDLENAEYLDPYMVFNLGLGMTIRKNYDLAAKVKNVFDKRYQEEKGYPLPGREYLFSVSGKF
jgi:outer membrane receptor for ferrienterochelin and colicins